MRSPKWYPLNGIPYCNNSKTSTFGVPALEDDSGEHQANQANQASGAAVDGTGYAGARFNFNRVATKDSAEMSPSEPFRGSTDLGY